MLINLFNFVCAFEIKSEKNEIEKKKAEKKKKSKKKKKIKKI